MTRYQWNALFVAAAVFVSSPALAELPSLMTDRAQIGTGREMVPSAFEALRQGTVRTNFGAIDYQFASAGLETRFRLAGTSTRALLGYDGEHRIEVDWRASGGNLKFALTAQDGDGGYRIEFVRSF